MSSTKTTGVKFQKRVPRWTTGTKVTAKRSSLRHKGNQGSGVSGKDRAGIGLPELDLTGRLKRDTMAFDSRHIKCSCFWKAAELLASLHGCPAERGWQCGLDRGRVDRMGTDRVSFESGKDGI